MLKNKDELRMASVGDIHLGHRRNKTENILEALDSSVCSIKTFEEIDLLVVEGDVFDRLLDLANPNVLDIDLWWNRLCRRALKHKVTILCLEGTPSHDWKQIQRLVELNNSPGGIGADIHYAKDLSVVSIAKLDKTFLCVPDEWDVSCDKTLEQAKAIMKSKGLQQVDFAIMHGNFPHQLPSHIKNVPMHDPVEYMALVKEFIMIGHNHKPSVYQDKIFAAGSFDRLSHGEEEAKGWWMFNVTKAGYTWDFRVNDKARTYITVDVTDLGLDESLLKLRDKVHSIPEDSCVRVKAESANPIFSNMTLLSEFSTTATWSKLVIDIDKAAKEELEATEDEYDYIAITITNENILQLVGDRMRLSNSNAEFVDRSLDILRSCM